MSEHSLVQVRIVGVGVNKTVTIEDGTDLATTIDEAQLAAADSGKLQLRVNGEAVEDPATFTPSDGDTIVIVPPQVKLGA